MAPGGQHESSLKEESRAARVLPIEAVPASVVARLGWRWAAGPLVALSGPSVKVGSAM